MPNKKKLYEALKAEGYDNFADESSFNAYVDNADNRKKLFSALKQEGYDNFADETEFEKYLGYNNSEDNAVFEANAERFRNGQPIERVTTQSVIDANPELGLQTNAVQPEVDQTQQYIMNNKPTIFGGKKKSLMDVPLNVSPDAIEGGENLEKLSERARIAEHNMKDPFVQKARTEADVRGLVSEIDGLLEKSVQEGRASVGGSAFMPAGARGRAYTEANKERVKEVTDLSSAKRLLDQSQYIIDAAKRGDTGILKDTWQGFKDSLEAEDFTFGLADAASSASILDAIKKVENGEELTEAEDKLLRASAINMATQYYYANDLNRAYKAGQVSAESVPFMLEMAINPISSLGKASAKTLLNYGLKSYAKQVGKGLAKGAAAGTGMALTTGLGRVAAGTTDRLAEGYNYGVDFDGNLYAEKKEDAMGVGEAAARSLASTAIENQSEMIFNAFKGFGGFMKGVQDVLPGGVNKFFNMLSHNKVADAYRYIKNSPVFRNYLVKDIRNATQIGGLGEEYLEEVYNNIANAAIGEMKWEDVVSLDKNIDTLLGLAPTQVMFGLLGLGGAGAMRYQTRKTLEDLQATMNEQQRKDLEGLLDMGLDAKEVDVRGFIRNVMQNESYTIENKRDLIKAAYNVAKQNGIDELTEADTIDKVNAENSLIDSVTDPSTGIYTEITATLPDAKEGTIEVPGYVVGWLGEGEKRQPIFVQEGMDNTYENRRVLKPGQWSEEAVQQMPVEEVKAINEEMIREEAAQQAELESKYAPEVLKAEMKQDVPFIIGDEHFTPVGIMPEGNGWVVDVREIDENGKVAEKAHDVIELTYDEFRKKLQAQLEAQEAAQEQIAAEEQQAAAPEVVEENVTEEAAQPIQPTEESVIKENFTTETGNDLSPVEEAAQPQAEVKPQTPVIPTKEDGSIDFVSYGKEGTFKTLGEKYGEKMPNKVAVTAKALAEDLKKAQNKLQKAEEAYDNAPIGREQKAEEARDKANQELEAIQREANFWAEMDAEIKDAQARRESILNPQAEVETSTEPMNVDEFVAQQLASGNIVLDKEDYKKETGYGDTEANAMNGGATKLFGKNGMTIQEAGERLMEIDRENGTNFFDQLDSNSGRDALINVLGSVKSRKELNQYIASNRSEQAKKESEGLRNELEKQAMEANYASLEDYVLQMEVEEMENPFLNDRADEIMAIFAEEAAKYEQSLNNTENGQGTENEVVEGNDSILPEEQLDNTGRTEVSEESERIGDGTSEESESTHAATEVELKQEEGETILQFAERAAEENRRRPLRKRAEEWSNTLGVKVTYLESIDDVDAKTRVQIEAAHAKGSSVSGWVDKNGEVFFFMPDLRDLKDVDDTYIHEVVAHVGLPQLLGKERFGELCDKVWAMMPQADKDYYYNYPGVNSADDSTKEGKIERQRRAADEYIAHLAEQQNLTPEERTIWDNIVKMFREMLDKALNGIVSKSKLTDEDISNLIKASYANLKSGAEGVSGEGTRFRTLEEVNQTFNEYLQKQIDGVLPQGYVYSLGNASDILRSAGIPYLPIEMASSRLSNKSNQENHPFELSEITDLPKAIQNPLAVFDSATRIGSNVILTELKQGNKNFVVAIETNRRQGKIYVNSVRSIHPRTTNNIVNWINEGLLGYANKETLKEWLDEKIKTKDYLNSSNPADVRKSLVSAANIVKDFQNPTLPEEKTSFRVVTDKNLIDKLESEPRIKVYRAMQLIDGKLYPPMSAKVDGKMREPIELGKWEMAEERPDLADEKGYFKLDKGNKSSLKARYNPYIHTSTTPLNDQFSSAQSRPELVTVEVEIPESELTSGYKAEKAKDAVGKVEWKAGVVQGKLSGTRTVILSRYDKPIRIVPDSEVADEIVKMFDGKDITMPSNVVTPSLRAELEKRGVPFVETDNQGKAVGPRFRAVKDENGKKTLVGLHNISEDKLRKAIKQGGLANPSMAVIDMDKQSHVDYGDITLVAPSSLVDKKTGKNIGTYSADAWTPIYPQVEKQMSKPGAKEYSKELEQVPSELRSKVRLYFNAYLEDGNTSGALNYWFLHDTGKNPPLLTSQSNDYTNEELDAIEAISNAGYYSGLNEEEKQKVLELFIEKQGGKDVFEKNIADRIETMKKNLQRPDIKLFIKKKVEQTLQGIEEYGYDYEQVSNFYANAQRAINNRGKIDEFRTFRNAQDIVNNEGLQGEFDKWLSEKEEQFGVEEYIFVGYNNNGDRKYIPNTLENASRIMKKEGRAGATGLYGFNHFVATLAPNAGSLVQIRKKKENLSSQEEYKAFVDKWGSVYHDLAEVLRGDYDGYSDVGYYRLEEMPTVKNPKEYVKKEYGIDLSDEFMQKYNDFVSAIKNDFPARYFETKFERPVYLNEFVAAVVPSDMGLDLYGQLQRMGIPMYEYERGNNEARMAAVDKVTIDNEGVRFRFIGERGARNLDKAEEATTRLDNLAVAREMEAAEKDAKTIKMATGWERGADGLWRYETMDSETAIKNGDEVEIRKQIEDIEEEEKAYKKKAREEGIGPDEREEAYLNFYRRRGFLEAQLAYVMAKNADVLTHISTSLHHVLDKTDSDSLFKAYPELEFVKVGFATELVGKSLGATVINGSRIEAINLDVKRSTPEELNGYLAHEIQHAIQEIEGFAPGGDPSMESPRKAEQKAKNISFMKDKLDKSVSERNSLLKQRNEINDKMSAWWDAHEDATREDMLADKDMQQFNREYDELSKQIDEADNTVKFNEKWLDATLQANTALGYEGYKKLAGEVEARNVTSRLGMTLEQRRNSLASETEDVAREDQIFLKDGIESGMRFRVSSQKRKEISKAVADYTSKYSSQPVYLVDDSMSDLEKVNLFDRLVKLSEINNWIREKKAKACLLRDNGKIYIFADNISPDDVELSMFHENLHAYIADYSELMDKVWERMKDIPSERLTHIKAKYKEEKWKEEFFVYTISLAQKVGYLGEVKPHIDEAEMNELIGLLNKYGYDYEKEYDERRRARASKLDGQGRSEDRGRVRTTGSGTEGLLREQRERKARLNELFNQVADMGLQGVLGNKEYTSLMVDIYKALPEEVRAEIAEDALRLYGGSVAPAVSDYIGPKSKNSIMDKVVTIVREALRKIGFDLDLNANEVRYMAWRSKKPLDRNNMFEVAEDIDMKYRLKVGEYDGTTPDGGGTRFRVTKEKLEGFSKIYKEFKTDNYGLPSYAQEAVDSALEKMSEEMKANFGDNAFDFFNNAGEILTNNWIKQYEKENPYFNGFYKYKDVIVEGNDDAQDLMDGILEVVPKNELEKEENIEKYIPSEVLDAVIIPNGKTIKFMDSEVMDILQRVTGKSKGEIIEEYGTEGLEMLTDEDFDALHNEGTRFRVVDESPLMSDLESAYKAYDKKKIQSAVDNIQEAILDGEPISTGDIDWESVEDYNGENPKLLAAQYIVRAQHNIYLEKDTDQEYIRTGIKSSEYKKQTDKVDEPKAYTTLYKEEQQEYAKQFKDKVLESQKRHRKGMWLYNGLMSEDEIKQKYQSLKSEYERLIKDKDYENAADTLGNLRAFKYGFRKYIKDADIEMPTSFDLKEGTRFRVANKLQVRDEYEATIKKGGYQAREAVQDAMLSLRKFQELIEKATGKKIRDFENAWMHENRLSSIVQAEIHDMERKFYKPMMDAVKKLMSAANLEQEQVADYLMLKHGIERNREMAVRKALTDDKGKIDRTRLEQWYQDKRNVRNRAATPHLDTWRKQQEELDNIALLYGADMSRDYSGLTSMFGTDDLADSTQKAYDEVEALENAHPVETESLGKAIKTMTQNTLDKSFESGLMDRKVYDELSKDMYDYYIPLRGFEETTSEEVYAYLDQDRGAFNAPLKRAKGRSSKSDNPIAYLKSIAESGIMQGNRNKMKQSFLNMVINNPSDLVSVREGVWVIYNPASGEWEAASAPAIPNNATPADVEAAMEAWEQQMEQAAQKDPNIKKASEAADVPYRVVGNRMDQHQIIVKRLGKSYTLTINGNPRLAMAINGQTNPNNTSNDGKVAAFVNNKIGSINRSLAAWYTTRNPDFVASNFMRDTFYTNTIVRAKEGNAYANKFHKNYATVLPKMLGLFRKYENGTLNPADQTEAAFLDFMMNGGETGYSNLKDVEEIKKQIAKELKGNRFAKVEALAEKLDILNRAVENTARFAAFLTSREEGRSIAKSVFDAKEISVNFNKKGAGGTFFGMTGQTWFGNLAAMIGASGRALYVFFNAAIQGSTNLMHVMKINPKGTSAGLAAMFLMGAVIPFLFDDDDEKDYYDLPEHVRRNHLIIPGAGDAWISIPLPIEYRIMYGMGELLTSWRTGHERGSDIGRKMLNLTGQALPLNFLEEGFDAFIPSALSPVWQVYNNRSWTGLPIYKDNEFNKDDPEYTKAYSNVDRNLLKFTKALYEWSFDEENQKERIDLNPAIIETLAKGYFGGLATQLSNIAKVGGMIAGEQEFDWRNIPIGNKILKTGDERTKEKRVTNEYFENMEKLDFLQSRERMLKKTDKGVAVPEADKFKAQKDLETMQGTEVYKKYQEFKKQKKVVDKIRKTIKEKGSTPEREKQLMEAQEKANKSVR